MAHSAIHFSLGAVTGSLLTARPLLRAWRRRDRMSGPLLRWLLFSHGTALFAIVPSLLRHIGVPERWCRGWWMNLFVFHPLLDRLIRSGTILGTLLIVALPTCQYVFILAALRRKLRDLSASLPKSRP